MYISILDAFLLKVTQLLCLNEWKSPSFTFSNPTIICIENWELRFKKNISGRHQSFFCGVTGTHVLDLCWCIPWISKPEGSVAYMFPHLCAMGSSDSHMVQHLLTCWWPVWQLSLFYPCTCTHAYKHWWDSNLRSSVWHNACSNQMSHADINYSLLWIHQANRTLVERIQLIIAMYVISSSNSDTQVFFIQVIPWVKNSARESIPVLTFHCQHHVFQEKHTTVTRIHHFYCLNDSNK